MRRAPGARRPGEPHRRPGAGRLAAAIPVRPAVLAFTPRELEGALGRSSLERGQICLDEGRVSGFQVHPGGELVTGIVRGERGSTYRVLASVIRDDGGRLRVSGHCSCPVGHNCKHVAAVLLPLARDSAPRAATGGVPVIAPDVELWLQGLERATSPGHAAARPAETLVYTLDTSEGSPPQPVVGVFTVPLRRDGSQGQPRRLPLTPNSRHPVVSPDDRQVAALLVAVGGQTGLGFSGPLSGDALRAVLTTGRARLRRADGPPVQLGPGRPGALLWQAQEGGRQRLVLTTGTEGTVVLGTDPPWYLDPVAGLCGPLETGLAPPVLSDLLAAPPVEPADAAAVAARLDRVPALGGLPRPRAYAVRELGAERPVPCLTLSSKPLPAGWTRPGEEAWEHYATLAFDYAGHRIAAGDPREVVEHADGDTLLRITRARRAEVAAVRRLRALQLVAVAAMGPAGDPDVYVASGDLPHWVSLLREGFPALERDGWHIERAPGFRLSLVEPERWYADVADSGDWFDLELGIEVEGQRVPLLPVVLALTRDLTKLAAEGRPLADLPTDGWWPYPLPRGGILRLPVQRVRTILATLLELYDPRTEAAPGLRLPRLAAHRLSELDGLAAGGIAWAGADALRAFGERLRNPRVQGEVEPPRGLRAKLRDYQLAGLRWLQFLRELGLGGVLADDMGLGKTVQTLAHLLLEREAGRLDRPALVVAPTSLVVNWRRETARFAPDLRVLVLHGLERKARFEAVPRHDLVLTTYPLLARDLERLSRYEYHVLVLDEAQHIKNPKTKASRAARTLHARQRLCLTGTPMENHLGELWSLFDLLLPGFLGDETRFRRAFRVPIEQHGDEARRTALTRRVAPFLLRRTKTEVARELPPKTEITRTVALAGGQRDLYETVRASMHAKVRQAIARRGLERSRIEVLEALLRLREICCDPRLLEGEGARAVRESAKLELLLEMLPALVEEGRRVLVYSQFTRMLALIEPELTRLGLPFVKLTGQTRDRATPVDRFQAGEIPIFLISLKAGGTGLNLTAADTVIHYDPWWNPAVERQASGRAHRIGQDKPVFVYRLLTEGTVEEKIAELQARKAALADAVFGEGTGVASALTATDLEGLFDPL